MGDFMNTWLPRASSTYKENVRSSEFYAARLAAAFSTSFLTKRKEVTGKRRAIQIEMSP